MEEELFLRRDRNYWKFPLFSGKAVAGEELNGEINKVAWLMLNPLYRRKELLNNLHVTF